jgi:hypothetical protein
MALPAAPATDAPAIVQANGVFPNQVNVATMRLYWDYNFARWEAVAGCEVIIAGIARHKEVTVNGADALSALNALLNAIAALIP